MGGRKRSSFFLEVSVVTHVECEVYDSYAIVLIPQVFSHFYILLFCFAGQQGVVDRLVCEMTSGDLVQILSFM